MPLCCLIFLCLPRIKVYKSLLFLIRGLSSIEGFFLGKCRLIWLCVVGVFYSFKVSSLQGGAGDNFLFFCVCLYDGPIWDFVAMKFGVAIG